MASGGRSRCRHTFTPARENRTARSAFTSHLKEERTMADDKMKSENTVPQADKQAHTEIAEREGKEGAQARKINKEEAEKAEKRKDS
jgi:hypothetical protein